MTGSLDGEQLDPYREEFETEDPLPAVKLESLEQIEKMITFSLNSSVRKEKIIRQLLKSNVILIIKE